jgi:branched-chain amino acid transport system permease protein
VTALARPALAGLALLLAVALLPLLLNSLWIRILTSAAIYAVAAAGTALLYARLGLVSLMQGALIGVGGWVALRTWHATHLPFEVNMLAGALAAALLGALLGLPALRMRGLYFALISLMAAAAFQVLATATQFPNGGEGWLGVSRSSAVPMARPWLGRTDAAMLRYALAVAALTFAAFHALRRAAPGRAWALIRRSEACALAAGVNVPLHKLLAFALAGFAAGIAGALLAATLGLLDARSFPAGDSILLFALTVVGGAWSWLGQVLTGLLFRAAPALLNDLGVDGDLAYLLFGAALIHALVTAPAGIAGQILARLGRRR